MAARSSVMDFQVPRITHEEVDANHGVFAIEPLDRGFGYTFGNSLRRVRLSSLEGPAEGNRGQSHTMGVIPVDSMFSPIRRVAYDVEAARVGQRTDYDKLSLDVTTNGSIDPKDAIAQAAEILIRQLAIFTDLERIEGFGDSAAPVDGGVDAGLVPNMGGMENFPIEELELGVRSYNC